MGYTVLTKSNYIKEKQLYKRDKNNANLAK